MKKIYKSAAVATMMGLLTLAVAGCGDDKAAPVSSEKLKFGVTNFADSLEPTDNFFGWVVMR